MENTLFSVSDFIAVLNQTLEYAYPVVEIEGEVASFKVNQGKYVFFDLKDAGGSIGCFMTVWQLRMPIEDGMKVVVRAAPKLTQWGKFSLTVQAIRPQGEGALKKSFELLKAKLDKEGLFAAERKRPLPSMPTHIGVISSVQAAGYADFIKILSDRWGGVRVDVAQVQVQGEGAPDQIIRAIQYFGEQEQPPEVVVIVRGGGSADDLAAFNDELLVRAVAASRVPILIGVGHETDESLADLAADVRAATPSNAAQLLVPDKHDVMRSVRARLQSVVPHIGYVMEATEARVQTGLMRAAQRFEWHIEQSHNQVERLRQVLAQLNPELVLKRGYALVRGDPQVGAQIEVETFDAIIQAKVEIYDKK